VASAGQTGGTFGPAAPVAAFAPRRGKTRRARLAVSRVSPWKVLQIAFLLSVALGVVTVVGLVLLWVVLNGTGVVGQLDSFLSGTLGTTGGAPVDLGKAVGVGQVAAFATVLAVVNVVVLTALSVVAAFVYNVCGTLVGGVGVILADG
jgi:hypothetical protein